LGARTPDGNDYYDGVRNAFNPVIEGISVKQNASMVISLQIEAFALDSLELPKHVIGIDSVPDALETEGIEQSYSAESQAFHSSILSAKFRDLRT
jgi:hypothetical protein